MVYMISEFTSGRLFTVYDDTTHVNWKHGFASFNENVNVSDEL